MDHAAHSSHMDHSQHHAHNHPMDMPGDMPNMPGKFSG